MANYREASKILHDHELSIAERNPATDLEEISHNNRMQVDAAEPRR